MALTRFHLLSEDEYKAARLQLLSIAEGVKKAPYIDTDRTGGRPTIGIGFNLTQKHILTTVLEGFGFDWTTQRDVDYRTEIEDVINDPYTPSSGPNDPQHQKLRDDLNEIMGRRAAEIGVGARTSFAYNTVEEMQGTFDNNKNLAPFYEKKLDIWLSNKAETGFPGNPSKTNIGPVPFSRERIALFSLAFNTKDGKTSLLGPSLARALDNNNRAEAWYEIRYNSNGNEKGGIAKRRFAESSLFGLYEPESIWDEADDAWYEEAKMVFAMVEDRREKILQYEHEFQVNRNDAKTEFAGLVTVKTFEEEIEDAKSRLMPSGVAESDIQRIFSDVSSKASFNDKTGITTIDVKQNTKVTIAGRETVYQDDLILGTDGKDIIMARDGNDYLYGHDGDDTLKGGEGDDVYVGGEGKDILKDELGGYDTYLYNSFSEAHDTISDSDGKGQIILDEYDTDIILSGGTETKPGSRIYESQNGFTYELKGTVLIINDSLSITDFKNGELGITLTDAERPSLSYKEKIGSPSDDQDNDDDKTHNALIGTDGSDKLLGLGGDDNLYGMEGDDWLEGGPGNDYMVATPGDDQLYGGLDRDTLIAGIGDDLLVGGAGDDFLTGGSGWDRLEGDGSEVPASQAGSDILAGGADHDILIGGAGQDYLFGDATYLPYDRTWSVTVTGKQDEYGSYESITINNVYGDVVSNADGNDWLEGGDGDDYLFGGGGSDSLYGDADNDGLTGQGGDDWLDGGEGDDTLLGDGFFTDTNLHGNDILYGGSGNDYLSGDSGDDSLFGGDGDDQLLGDGATHGDELGWTGHDYLDGGEGNDRVWGGAGDDYLIGGAGNDEIGGEAGQDILYGDEGNDILAGGDGNDRLYGGSGADQLVGELGNDTLYGGTENDKLWGHEGSDDLYGESGDDILVGGEDQDYLEGGLGNDELYGDAGEDQLFAGEGDDKLWGHADNDILDGGSGADYLEPVQYLFMSKEIKAKTTI